MDIKIGRCTATNVLAAKSRKSSAGRLLVTPRSENLIESQFVSPVSSPASPSVVNLRVSEGSDVTLECLATGNPLPKVTWKWNASEELVSSDRVSVHRGFVLLTNVDKSMAGEYWCIIDTGFHITSVQVTSPAFLISSPKSQVLPSAKTVRFECVFGGHPIPEVRWLKVNISN